MCLENSRVILPAERLLSLPLIVFRGTSLFSRLLPRKNRGTLLFCRPVTLKTPLFRGTSLFSRLLTRKNRGTLLFCRPVAPKTSLFRGTSPSSLSVTRKNRGTTAFSAIVPRSHRNDIDCRPTSPRLPCGRPSSPGPWGSRTPSCRRRPSPRRSRCRAGGRKRPRSPGGPGPWIRPA